MGAEMTGKELTEWRGKMCVTQAEAAALLGMSRRQYVDSEAASSVSTRTELACIALWHRLEAGHRPWVKH